MATAEKIKVLTAQQIEQKIQRIAHEIYENYHQEKKIVLVGIAHRGYEFANRLKDILSQIAEFEITFGQMTIDKDAPLDHPIHTDLDDETWVNQPVLLVDDVLNSGHTLAYAVRHILGFPVKSLKTVILVNREHHRYPVTADFVGLNLATTMQEHISVDFSKKSEGVYLL
ncbi:phosphoribosyltransferase [bacterium SCSIO 12741]|nr:phosphoribosyltransferase [bacterium SCSIO 12741]